MTGHMARMLLRSGRDLSQQLNIILHPCPMPNIIWHCPSPLGTKSFHLLGRAQSTQASNHSRLHLSQWMITLLPQICQVTLSTMCSLLQGMVKCTQHDLETNFVEELSSDTTCHTPKSHSQNNMLHHLWSCDTMVSRTRWFDHLTSYCTQTTPLHSRCAHNQP
jgi:hypothetical protein